MCSLLVISDRDFDVNIVAFAAEHLPAAGRATLYITAPMVVIAVLGTAVSAAFTRASPASLTEAETGIYLAVAGDRKSVV